MATEIDYRPLTFDDYSKKLYEMLAKKMAYNIDQQIIYTYMYHAGPNMDKLLVEALSAIAQNYNLSYKLDGAQDGLFVMTLPDGCTLEFAAFETQLLRRAKRSISLDHDWPILTIDLTLPNALDKVQEWVQKYIDSPNRSI